MGNFYFCVVLGLFAVFGKCLENVTGKDVADVSLGPQLLVYTPVKEKVSQSFGESSPACILKTSGIQAKAGIFGERFRWRNGINFQLDRAFSNADVTLISNAVFNLSTVVCVTTKIWPVTARATGDYVFIRRGPVRSGCWSYVGRQGGRQILNLEPGCVRTGTVLHEAIHALGFQHEQARSDRDTYVEILWQNIIPADRYNYNRDSSSLTFSVPYDYRSIMHYRDRDFSSNGRTTIKAKNGEPLGSLGVLTNFDRQKIRRMYNCSF